MAADFSPSESIAANLALAKENILSCAIAPAPSRDRQPTKREIIA